MPPPRALIRTDILCAWKGPSLLVVTTRGDVGPDPGLCGYYFREARFLSACRLDIDGSAPWLCEAAALSPDRLEFAYTFPEVASYGGGGSGQSGDDEPRNERGLPQRGLNIALTYRVGIAGLDIGTVIANDSKETLEFEAGWRLDADFADIQEAQGGGNRQQQAAVGITSGERALVFQYNHERLPYRSTLSLPADARWDGEARRMSVRVRLEPQERIELGLTLQPADAEGVPAAAELAARERFVDAWQAAMSTVASPRSRLCEAVLTANIRDAASFPLLEGPENEWLAMQAGVPLYPAFFGRDALTAGWQMAMLDRGATLDAALSKLGRHQSTRIDDWHDEQPGRIPYQMRRGPLAILNINPYSAYYADYASPLMYVVSLANLFAWTGDRQCLRRHWDTARRILDWAREYGDMDGDGYLEYLTRSSTGTKNQGWKDSGDAVIYDDGSPVPSPTATCELQAYWYAAQQLMGLLSGLEGHTADARAHLDAAADLKARFNRDWWSEQDGFFGLALDPGKRLVRAASSNVGHCLATGIIDRAHIPAVVGRLFAPDMFSGWGIRTLSSDHAYYNPVSYHRGTVWAVEQASILFGLRRFGYDARAHDLAGALFDLAQLYPDFRIPECVGGYARGEPLDGARGKRTPGAYPQANAPQLWNATAFPLTVQCLMGMLPLAHAELLVIDPVLPAWLPELIVRGLRVGRATVDLRATRTGDGRTDFEVLHKQGTLRIVRQPPPESLTAGTADRLHGVFDTVVEAIR
jgi:glycogen debranching enzyme